jgi:hypothetical protein
MAFLLFTCCEELVCVCVCVRVCVWQISGVGREGRRGRCARKVKSVVFLGESSGWQTMWMWVGIGWVEFLIVPGRRGRGCGREYVYTHYTVSMCSTP